MVGSTGGDGECVGQAAGSFVRRKFYDDEKQHITMYV